MSHFLSLFEAQALGVGKIRTSIYCAFCPFIYKLLKCFLLSPSFLVMLSMSLINQCQILGNVNLNSFLSTKNKNKILFCLVSNTFVIQGYLKHCFKIVF